jgi:hypothetical protein
MSQLPLTLQLGEIVRAPLMRPHQGPKKPLEFATTETIMKKEMPMMYVLGSSTTLGAGGGGGGAATSPPPNNIATSGTRWSACTAAVARIVSESENLTRIHARGARAPASGRHGLNLHRGLQGLLLQGRLRSRLRHRALPRRKLHCLLH